MRALAFPVSTNKKLYTPSPVSDIPSLRSGSGTLFSHSGPFFRHTLTGPSWVVRAGKDTHQMWATSCVLYSTTSCQPNNSPKIDTDKQQTFQFYSFPARFTVINKTKMHSSHSFCTAFSLCCHAFGIIFCCNYYHYYYDCSRAKVLVIPILQLSGRESTGCYVMLPRTRVYGREKDK